MAPKGTEGGTNPVEGHDAPVIPHASAEDSHVPATSDPPVKAHDAPTIPDPPVQNPLGMEGPPVEALAPAPGDDPLRPNVLPTNPWTCTEATGPDVLQDLAAGGAIDPTTLLARIRLRARIHVSLPLAPPATPSSSVKTEFSDMTSTSSQNNPESPVRCPSILVCDPEEDLRGVGAGLLLDSDQGHPDVPLFRTTV